MNPAAQTPYDILKNSILSKPRMMGTPQEKKTTEFLLNFLKQKGLSPYTEDFVWSDAFIGGRKKLFLMLGFFIILLNLSLRLSPPANGIVAILLSVISMGCMVFLINGLFNDRIKFTRKSSIGKNVICKINAHKKNEANTVIYFSAHTDSIASNAPQWEMKLLTGIISGYILVTILTISTGIVFLTSFTHNPLTQPAAIGVLETAGIIVGVITLLFIAASMFINKVNTSAGATDNGSGSAILLSLAEYYKENPPQNSRMIFIWCAGEEWGLYGSKGYISSHKAKIIANRNRSLLINIDMVGSELSYIDKVGLFNRSMNSKLNLLIEQCASETGIAVRKFNTFFSENSDHAPFRKEKIETCIFLAKKDLKIIHSPKDTIENVKPEKLGDAVELIKKMVEKIDQTWTK